MNAVSPADIEAMRDQGDLLDYLKSLVGPTRAPEQGAPVEAEPAPPPYTIPRPGAWPIGTAATGPTPGCPCSDCQKGEAP